MKIEGKHITAEDNKVLRRKSNQEEVGTERWLGTTYYMDGVKLDEPIVETAEDFEETWTQEYPLKQAKYKKIAEIEAYDVSENVNIFSINGLSLWLDRDTRASLMRRFEAEKVGGITQTTLWYGTTSIPLSVDLAIKALNAIELYACQAYDTTQAHKAAIDEMTDIEEVESFDETEGYPEPLKFEV